MKVIRHKGVKQTVRGRWRRAVGALVAVAITAGSMALASPANAWPWDARVTVLGIANCDTGTQAIGVPADEVWIYMYENGEIKQTGVDYWTESFSIRFDNVSSSGSWADVWLYCSVPGATPAWRYAGAIWVSRPWVTSTTWPYWVSA
jgi:hypothetical protein